MPTKNNNGNKREQEVFQHKEEDVTEKPTKEIGGPKDPEPTRYGDWEKKGRCIDF